jgi:hypothetical protein
MLGGWEARRPEGRRQKAGILKRSDEIKEGAG